MKTVFVTIAFYSLCSLAFAFNEHVPGSTNLVDLPIGARLLIKRDIDTKDYLFLGANFWFSSSKDIHLKSGMLLPLRHLPTFSSGRLVLTLKDPDPQSLDSSNYGIAIDPKAKIRTVSDFYARLNSENKNVVEFVYDEDPYKGMSDDMKQDLMMSKILDAIKADKYWDALPDFYRMEKTQKELPESFYYYFIVALNRSGERSVAQSRGRTFLEKYGKGSKYYQQVTAIMSE
jgi:hypothetical protein